MAAIAKVVMNFLEKYSSPEAVEKSLSDFQGELRGVINTLNVRIETEEAGVFDFYLLM